MSTEQLYNIIINDNTPDKSIGVMTLENMFARSYNLNQKIVLTSKTF